LLEFILVFTSVLSCLGKLNMAGTLIYS
jgi:hypothetical protein